MVSSYFFLQKRGWSRGELKLPVDMARIIKISDPVYSFNEVMDHIDLNKYFAEDDCKTGRPRYDRVKFELRQEYAIEYAEYVLGRFPDVTGTKTETLFHGTGKRKNTEQKLYEKAEDCLKKLKKYSEHIQICGDTRNSYSKTDHDATFFRMKKDYMGNDQLLPGYNLHIVMSAEFIAHYDVFPYAADMDCFQPLMEGFFKRYDHYPKYPVADAGYLVCPNGKRFYFLRTAPIRNNQYALWKRLCQAPRTVTIGKRVVMPEYVFHSPEGKAYQPNNWVNRIYRPFMKFLHQLYPDIPTLSPHELRHSRATLWIAQGMEPYIVARLLGHSDLKMLTKIYDHTSPETLRKALLSAKEGACLKSTFFFVFLAYLSKNCHIFVVLSH